MPIERHYTAIPNEILDAMGEMSGAEFRVVVAVCRATLGWRKRSATLSVSQLEESTGLGRNAVMDGMAKAIKDGWIERTADGQTFTYSVILEQEPARKEDWRENQTGAIFAPVEAEAARNEPEMQEMEQQPARKSRQLEKGTSAKIAPVPARKSRQSENQTGAKIAPEVARKSRRLHEGLKKGKKEQQLDVLDLSNETTKAFFSATPQLTNGSGPSAPDASKPTRTPQQLFFDRVCWVVGWDHRTLSKEQRGQVAQVVGVLQEAKYTADDIARFWQEVWKKDFRYRKDQSRPNLGQLRAEIGKLRVNERDMEAQTNGAGTELSEEEFRRQYLEAKQRTDERLAAKRAAAAGDSGVQVPHLPGQEVRPGGGAGDAPAVRQGDPLPVSGVGGPGAAAVVSA